ncbi:M10 family metallopeptidase domain-containing protein [Bacteriovoracaceae bacterium]|nr:M10 family metallopeptidase domain-containing protein [Bacteriovoracaceae bacterium]
MVKLSLIISQFIIFNSFSYTFIDKDDKFPDANINVYFGSNGCSGLSLSKMKSLTKKAAEDFWNKVSTSSLYLDVKSSKSFDASSVTDINTILNNTSKNTLMVICSEVMSTFEGDGRDTILGFANINCSSSESCRGYLVLNGHAGGALDSSSTSQGIATVAHEIGHAIGIGHSPSKHNLMYYSISDKKQEWLGQDDIDAVTHLYPHDKEMQGLLGNCGTIKDINQNDDFPSSPTPYNFLLQVLSVFSLFSLLSKLKIKLSLKKLVQILK